MDLSPSFTLSTRWAPATDDAPCRYTLTLTNNSERSLSGFALAVTGPARVDAAAEPENGNLLYRLSNHAVIAPPNGFVLAPGESWTTIVKSLNYPLRHWTDAARAAYLVLAGGRTLPVAVEPCRLETDDGGAPLLDPAPAPSSPASAPRLSVIPWPAEVRVSGSLEIPRGLSLPAGAVSDAFRLLVEELFPGKNLLAPGGLAVAFEDAADFAPEAYRIRFAAGHATIAASSDTGRLYGLITLGQIVRGALAFPERYIVPIEGEIVDRPTYGWRGCHLDVARQFYSMAEVSRLLAILAWNKLNRFHWHLTEDEAWRIESRAFPELVEIGAWRGHGLPIPPLLGSGAERYGGFYSHEDVKEVVTLAGRLGIEVVPEIDVPGHSFAALTALPKLRDPGENAPYYSIQGFPRNSLNPGLKATREFAETVFGELMDLFPSRYIHVGADEVPEDAWTGSPAAKARLAEVGGRTAFDLQADFLRQLHAFLRRCGRITGAWQEAALGGGVSPEGSYMVAWKNAEIGAKLAKDGYDVVMSPGQAYYLDMARSKEWWEPGASWAGVSSPENTYHFDPVAGWDAAERRRMIGVQACIWSEPMSDRRIFERLVFPRLSAIAETGWSPFGTKDWRRFEAAAYLMPTLLG